MKLNKADLIIHPVRLKILQTLTEGPMTTQEISEVLNDIPTSSIYRHLKLLLDGDMVEVAETRPVKGIQEKIYRLAKAPKLSPEDVADFSKEDHLRYFTSYTATLLQGFADYISSSNNPDLVEDRVGYNEVIFYASQEELVTFAQDLNKALLKVVKNKPAEGKQKRKIAIISFPLDK